MSFPFSLKLNLRKNNQLIASVKRRSVNAIFKGSSKPYQSTRLCVALMYLLPNVSRTLLHSFGDVALPFEKALIRDSYRLQKFHSSKKSYVVSTDQDALD